MWAWYALAGLVGYGVWAWAALINDLINREEEQ